MKKFFMMVHGKQCMIVHQFAVRKVDGVLEPKYYCIGEPLVGEFENTEEEKQLDERLRADPRVEVRDISKIPPKERMEMHIEAIKQFMRNDDAYPISTAAMRMMFPAEYEEMRLKPS
jgi:hypothetical protein